jgi:acyl carrier protein
MMTQREAMDYIATALRKVIKKDKIEFSLKTDLVLEKILDSLDRLVFLLELSEMTKKEFPEDMDIVKVGLFKVSNLVDYLTDGKNISDFRA